jgi:hypothetical protein
MKRILFGTAILTGMAMLSGTYAFAQAPDEEYHREQRGDAYWANRLFDRVRADLDHVQAMVPTFSGEQFGLAKAKRDLNELQANAAAGRFDDRNLDEVINALQRVENDRNLSERDRTMITDDMSRLRQYRERHERYYSPRG